MKRVLVVGDVIADVYRDCTFKKMCPDAPGVKALVTHSTDLRPGGAANVAVNLAALSPETRIHLVGEMDTELARRIKFLSHSRVSMDHCLFNDDPIRKERISLDGRMLLRVDNRAQTPSIYAEGIEAHLREYLAEHDPDLIVVSDYGSGALNSGSWSMLLAARDRLLVDTKLTDLSAFGEGGRTRLIKLNYDEWRAVTALEAAPERFFQALIATSGGQGAHLRVREERGPAKSVTHTISISAHEVHAVDVCGCGDTFMAGLAASLLKSDDYFTAMQFANAAAATVVTQERTSVADLGLTLGMLGWEERV